MEVSESRGSGLRSLRWKSCYNRMGLHHFKQGVSYTLWLRGGYDSYIIMGGFLVRRAQIRLPIAINTRIAIRIVSLYHWTLTGVEIPVKKQLNPLILKLSGKADCKYVVYLLWKTYVSLRPKIMIQNPTNCHNIWYQLSFILSIFRLIRGVCHLFTWN